MQSIQDRKELTDISEEVTKRLAIKRKPQGLGENIEVAKKGSNVAKNTRDDIEELARILNNTNFERPNLKISIYKNRRGSYKGIYLWCNADLGTCRVKPMFATSYSYELIQIDNLKIEAVDHF